MEKAVDAQKWHRELKRYDKAFEKWKARGDKIVKRFRDERKGLSEKSKHRYNILWSNVQTLRPAVFSRVPKSNVTRRFSDRDPIARTASTMIERCLEFEVEQFTDYFESTQNAVMDRLLPGRGTCWVRYEPEIEEYEIQQPMITDDVGYDEDESGGYGSESMAESEPEMGERVISEHTPVDYVYWKDFAYDPARTWEEVEWVARRAYLSKDEGIERFGEVFKMVPLDNVSDDDEGEGQNKKAGVWEIWHKSKGKVIWVATGCQQLLDERDDPLELECFFPCPKPIFSTITTDTLVPVPDYALYQNQAQEMDLLSERIHNLQQAMKLVGVYDTSSPELSKLLQSDDNTLVPVKNWAAFTEKGGVNNGVQFLPIAEVAQVLSQLYEARESVKSIIYEITGISDIIRGASMASETATAQQIKSQFASLRLNDMRDDIERFCVELLRIKAEIICSKYQDETIVQMSGIMQTDDAQHAEQALALLRDESLRNYRVEIETDSLIKPDQSAEQQNRVMFLQTAGTFLKNAVDVGQQVPELGPLIGEMLMFGVRGFKTARPIEAAFENATQALQEKGQNGTAQAQQQLQQMQEQMQQMQQAHQDQLQQVQASKDAQMKAQADQAGEQTKAQVDMAKNQSEERIKSQQLEFEQWKTRLENATKVIIAENSKNMNIDSTEDAQAEALAILSQKMEEMNAPRMQGEI